MTVSEQIAEYLALKGCTHAFGIVGGANLALFEAISRRLQMISVGHEQAAAMAANYHYRAGGKIAPVVPTNGGGTTNTITGVVEAYMDGIPMLIISGNEQQRFIRGNWTRTNGFQGVRTCDIVHSFTKKAVSVDNPLAAKMALDSLYREALTARQGPCWLDVPQDVATALAE